MKQVFYCLLLSFILPFFAYGKTNIAGLTDKLKTAENESQRVGIYDSIFIYYEYANIDSGLFYMKQGLSHFLGNNYKPGIAAMLSNLGGIYSSEGMLEIAKKSDEEALKIYIAINDKNGIANTNNLLGVIDGRKGNYSEAEAHFLIALPIFKDKNDTSGIADTYIKLGTSSEKNNNPDKALEYYYKGLAYYKGKPVNDIVIFLKSNIGASYFDKNDTFSAMRNFREALEASIDPAFIQIRMLPLQNMGDTYAKMGDTGKALLYSLQALDIAAKEHLQEERCSILISIADLYLRRNPVKALDLLNEALQIAGKIGVNSIEINILNNIINIYQQKGKYKEAFYWQEKQKILLDSSITVEKSRANANIQAKYELDKLTLSIEQHLLYEQKEKQKRTIIINEVIIIAILINLLLFVVIFYYLKTKKLNNELHNREINLAKANIVKNKLISIIAHDLLGVIGFMPLSLGLCRDRSIPDEEKDALLSQVELNAISSYETLQNMLDWGKAQIQGISLNQVNFNANEILSEVLKFVYIVANNKQIDIRNNIAPGLMIFADINHYKFIFRNLLANAIKFTHFNGVILINAAKNKDGSYIIFSVKDNGIGIGDDKIKEIFNLNTEGTKNENGNGIGLKLCKEFVIENGGEIWVESKKDKGAAFYFSLKVSTANKAHT